MNIAIITDDPDLGRSIATVVQDAGHQPTLEPHRADLLLIDRAAADFERRMRAAMAENVSLDVIALLTPNFLSRELPFDVEDFVVLPAAPGEIEARLRIWAHRRGTSGTSQENLLALAVEGAGDVVEIANPRAVLSYVNPAFTQTLGYRADEVVGKTPAQVMRSSMHTKEYFEELDRTLRAGLVWKGLLISRAKDGRLVHFEATVAPVFDSEGKITHHIAVKRDITDRLASEARLRAANEELAQARDQALSASRVKSQFLANMSHELRTPLNAIIGYSEMLIEEAEEGMSAEELTADLSKVLNAGRHLLGLINDILDLSKIEAGKMEVFFEDVPLRGLLDESLEMIKPLARERGNTVGLRYELEHEVVRADQTRLKQVVFNLLNNANKFTEDGTIDVHVREEADAEGYFIAVQDTGIGMSAEQMSGLFRPFQQADASTTRKYGGTGLGLTISQRFCELMGGKITVQSVEGEGSTFVVRLPLEPGLEEPPDPDLISGEHLGERDVRRVLLVDDDPAIHDLLLRTLEPAGFEVTSARGGEAGLAAARENPPDCIILDVVMPAMDGWAVLTELKKDPALATIPVVMLTFLQSRSAGLALGAADYLVKPVETSRLINVIRKHCKALPATVLVVEDDADLRELTRRMLLGAGHIVREAGNGKEALAALERGRPDLILLDLMMPEMDGFTFIDELRAQPAYADLPVIVVTAKMLSPGERDHLASATQRILRKGDYSTQDLMGAVLRHVRTVLTPVT